MLTHSTIAIKASKYNALTSNEFSIVIETNNDQAKKSLSS